MTVDIKRRIYDFHISRPIDVGNKISGYVLLREDKIDATNGSPTQGQVILSKYWKIELSNDDIMGLTNANQFLGSLISVTSNIKSTYDSTGSGSVSALI
jgi:hypothetical protein